VADLPKAMMDLLDYDPEAGILTWNVRMGGNGAIKAGTRAGCKGPSGYRYIKFKGQRYREHRIAHEWVHGLIPLGFEIDHANGIRDDNRIGNLRLATHQENIINQRRSKSNTSGKKGVHFHPQTGKWRAKISVNYKSISLGLHSSVEEAHTAYMIAAKKYFGAFARAA
jgi:hypothetical protein